LWLPPFGLVNVNVATPLFSAWLTGLPPSAVRDTLPLGVPEVELTVTVIVALAGYVTVGAEIELVVLAGFTTCDKAGEDVLVAKFVSPA